MRSFALCCLLIVSLGGTSQCNNLPFPPGTGDSARLSIVHLSPDTGLLDLCVDGTELFIDLAYEDVSDYEETLAGLAAINLISANAGCDAPGEISGDIELSAGTETTFVVMDFFSDLTMIVLDDDNSPPPSGLARVRFVHASPDTTIVDFNLSDGTLLFDDIAFSELGDYIEIAAGTYDFDVRNAAGTTLLLPVDDVTIQDGGVYTIYLVGLLAGAPDLDVFFTLDNG